MYIYLGQIIYAITPTYNMVSAVDAWKFVIVVICDVW